MNSIKNMYSEVKRTMQATWPVLPRNSDALWPLMSGACKEVVFLSIAIDH